MNRLIAFLFLHFIFCSNPVFGQSLQPGKAQSAAIHRFVEGYNRQDFGEMRSTFSWVFKLLFTKKKLRMAFGSQFEIFGPAKLVQVRQLSPSSSMLELAYAYDTTEHNYFGLGFTKKDKIIGFSTRSSEKFEYPTSIHSGRDQEGIGQLNARIDSLVYLKYSKGSFNGCVSVIDEGRTIYQKCYGEADRNNHAPLNPQSMFELASCSKQFTAMGIMMLAEQGKLNYGDDVHKYLPELPYKGISVENLLTHTAGLAEYESLLEKHWDKTKIAGNEDVLRQLARYKPKLKFKPGAKHEYSNTGYVLLAVLIERISGLSYGAFLDKNIFRPLSMTRTRVYNTRRAGESIPNYAWGYVLDNNMYVLPDSLADYDYVRYLDGITGDGTVNSCLEDLEKWENALWSNRLVSAETLKKAHSPHILPNGTSVPYGYGWEVQSNPKFAPLAHHSGSWPGYITFMLHFRDRRSAVIVLSNNEYLYSMRLGNRIAKLL